MFPPVFPCPDQVAQAAAGTVVQIAVADGLWPVADRIAAYRNYKNRLVAIQVLQLPCIHVGFLAPATGLGGKQFDYFAHYIFDSQGFIFLSRARKNLP